MITAEQQLQLVLGKVKDALVRRGNTTLRQLGKTFRQLDSFDGFNKVDRDEFYIGLKENGVQLSKQEADLLLFYLDKNRDGTIDYQEFLFIMRGQPNEIRQQVIDQAFRKFDRDSSNTLTVDDIRGVFDCSNHPKVVRGELTQEQALVEFLQNFGDANKDGVITKQEWDDYYASVSQNIENDEHFVLLMKNAWKLQ